MGAVVSCVCRPKIPRKLSVRVVLTHRKLGRNRRNIRNRRKTRSRGRSLLRFLVLCQRKLSRPTESAVESKSGFLGSNVLEHNALTGRIIGAAVTVHRELGPGFLESVYESALAVELRLQDIPFARQVSFPILYKDRRVGEHRLDLVVHKRVILELKAVSEIACPVFRVMRSYLRASGMHIGLILNFGRPALEVKRVFREKKLQQAERTRSLPAFPDVPAIPAKNSGASPHAVAQFSRSAST